MTEPEVRGGHLNLRDNNGATHGRSLPTKPRKMTVIDGEGRHFKAHRSKSSAIERLQRFYRESHIMPGTTLLVRFDSQEQTNPGECVVHIERQGERPTDVKDDAEECRGQKEFVARIENELEDVVASDVEAIEKGLRLYKDASGRVGRQYPTDVGEIDLLCVRPNGDFVVVELKLDRASDSAVGQVSRYMGWIKQHLAGTGDVHGVIVARQFDRKLKYAVAANPSISIVYYRLQFQIVTEEEARRASDS
ncbi:MAG: endonuclease NucS [candidate division WOR-3 bacterium]|nr:endonuclease NucS [candidate division WOR-3 bacterium]